MGRRPKEHFRWSVNLNRTRTEWFITIRYPYSLARQIGVDKKTYPSGFLASQPKELAEERARLDTCKAQQAAGVSTDALSNEAPAVEVLRLCIAQKRFESESTKKGMITATYYIEEGYRGISIGEVRATVNNRAIEKMLKMPRKSKKGPKAGTPAAASTIRAVIRSWTAAWNWAVRLGYINQRTIEKMSLPRSVKGQRTRKRPFEYHETLAIIAWFKHHPETQAAKRKRKRSLYRKHYPYFNLLSWLGGRANDTCSLTWRMISEPFINVSAQIVCSITWDEGKDEDKPESHVDVPAEVVEALGPRGLPDAYVFPSRYGKVGHIDPDTMLGKLKDCLRDLGLDASRYDQHSFRRSFVRDAGYGCSAAGLHPRDAAILSNHEVGYGMKVLAIYMARAKSRVEEASAALIDYRMGLASKLGDTGNHTGNQIVPAETLVGQCVADGRDSHQKYRLRQWPLLCAELLERCGDEQAFVDSTAAAKLNGYLAGYGQLEEIAADLAGMALQPATRTAVLERIQSRGPRR